MVDAPIRLIRELPVEAGQATIWLAKDVEYGDEVIVKYLNPSPNAGEAEADRRRFAREVRCQSALRHPSIMPILRYNVEAATPWYSMPKASTTFLEVLEDGRLSPEEIIDVLADVFDAIEYAHADGVLHRDLKPANILFLEKQVNGASGWVVADFGLCKDENSASAQITQTHTVVGSVAYMAPEQFDDAHAATQAADIYSIGKILAHAFTGRRPFPVNRLEEVPAEFRQVVRYCLADKPGSRYQNVAALRNDLIAVLGVDDSVLNSVEECTRIAGEMQEAVSPDLTQLDRLIRLLSLNSDDAVLHTDLVRIIRFETLALIAQRNPEEFRIIVTNFDRHTTGGFPWSFTDSVANFFSSVYAVTEDIDIRRTAMNRIMVIGYEHHRFHPRGVFHSIASQASGVEANMIANLLRDNAGAAAFLVETASNHTFAPVIRQAFPD